MSFLDSLFGGGGSKATTTTDGFKALPPFLQKLIEEQANQQQSAAVDMGSVRRQLADPNKSVAPLNSVEQAGLNAVTSAQSGIDALARDAADGARGVTPDIAALRKIDPTAAVSKAAAGLDSTLGRAIGDTQGIDIGALTAGYENQFTGDVVDTTLGRIDDDLARRTAASRLAANKLGGAGNTRQAVSEAVDQQLTTREKAAAEAQLRSAAFDTASKLGLDRGRFDLDKAGQAGDLGIRRGTALADINLDNARFGVDKGKTAASLGLEQSGLLSDLASAESSRAITEGSYLSAAGEKLRGLDQARLDAPRDALSWFAGVSQSPQMPSSTSQTVTNSGGNTWAQLAGAGLGAYQILSDEDTKSEGESIDGDDAMDMVRGLDPQTYSYEDGYGERPGQTAGFMAQDLEKVLPGAVGEGPDGLKRVDPYPLIALLTKAVQDLEARVG